MNKNLLPISKDGLPKIVYTLVFLLVTLALDLDILGFLSFVVLLGLIYIYRNPEREAVALGNNSVVSPVDGQVISIETLENAEYAYKIEIDSKLSNVAVLRAPMNAKVDDIKTLHGAKLSNTSTLFRKINEQSQITFKDENSNKMMVEHLSKMSFEDVIIDLYEDQSLVQSNRYGLVLNGITTLYLPHNFRVSVSVGNEVVASETLVGYFS